MVNGECYLLTDYFWSGILATMDTQAKHLKRANGGESHYLTRLTDEQVRGIRARHATGISLGVLAKEHKLSRVAIFKMVHRLSWAHVE